MGDQTNHAGQRKKRFRAQALDLGQTHYNGGDVRSDSIGDAGQKYISLTTFRKNGVAVATPVWFGEDGDKLYVMTRSDMGKAKRIRNNPRVRVAPCTSRGKVTGPEFEASARILPGRTCSRTPGD